MKRTHTGPHRDKIKQASKRTRKEYLDKINDNIKVNLFGYNICCAIANIVTKNEGPSCKCLYAEYTNTRTIKHAHTHTGSLKCKHNRKIREIGGGVGGGVK